jgi:uncharacterized membrane protein
VVSLPLEVIILKKNKSKFNYFADRFNKKIEEIADFCAEASASPWFIIFHLVWWILWVVFKVEPFPYGLLTMLTGGEAILLSALILSSTNREGEIEKKIARKTLNNSKETNWMTEEILEVVRDLQEDIRLIKDEEDEI